MMDWEFDGSGSWTAFSAVGDDGDWFEWRISVCDDGTFSVAESDAELTERTETFPSLSEAKKWCEEFDSELAYSVLAEFEEQSLCYDGIIERSPSEVLPHAISNLISAFEKANESPASASTHFSRAIVNIISCLPGWEPDDFQREEVDYSCKLIRILTPSLFGDTQQEDPDVQD